MEALVLPDIQTKNLKASSFDRKSRENYFEMLKVALENLSIVDERDMHQNDFLELK
jgi:hypothetical protein